MLVIHITPEEGRKLLARKRIVKEILLQQEAEQTKVSVYIRVAKTEEEKRKSRAHSARASKDSQEETLRSLGRERTQGRTEKPWTEMDKQELEERVSRGEESKQIALAMGRTFHSVRKARVQILARKP